MGRFPRKNRNVVRITDIIKIMERPKGVNYEKANQLIREVFRLILYSVREGNSVFIGRFGEFIPTQQKNRAYYDLFRKKVRRLKDYVRMRFRPFPSTNDVINHKRKLTRIGYEEETESDSRLKRK